MHRRALLAAPAIAAPVLAAAVPAAAQQPQRRASSPRK